MAFAKTYREEIVLAYYCFNSALAIAFFIIGTIYLRHRDRRDQRRKEWRQFAETIRSECNNLKAQNIPWKISKVKDTFGNIQIDTEITGLDVLRFMINSEYETFKTKELKLLCEDLKPIFQLLNTCASLILLGAVPHNVKTGLGTLIAELGELTLPFYKAEERAPILKCLKHFCSGGRLKVKTERKMRRIDTKLEDAVPYVKRLRFECSVERFSLDERRKYEECNRFRLDLGISVYEGIAEPLNFLNNLQLSLEEPVNLSEFARELREHPPNLKYVGEIVDSDSDDLVVVKMLHEVRVYCMHHIKEERKRLDLEIEENIEILKEVYERVTGRRQDKELIVRKTCENFMEDIWSLKGNLHQYQMKNDFDLKLQELHGTFTRLINENRLNKNCH